MFIFWENEYIHNGDKMITSKKNDLIKQIIKLKKSNYREKTGLILLEGERLVQDALNNGINPQYVVLADGKDISFPEYISCFYASDEVFKYISDTSNSQGVIAVFNKPEAKTIEDLLSDGDKTVFLIDRVQDPGNLGAIIRSADAFGIKYLLIRNGTCDPYNQKVIRSTMGSVFRTSMIFLESDDDVAKLRKNGYKLYTTVAEDGEDLSRIDFDEKSVVVIGNEANGVDEFFIDDCDRKITIKMKGKAESLNVAVATSIIMYFSSL